MKLEPRNKNVTVDHRSKKGETLSELYAFQATFRFEFPEAFSTENRFLQSYREEFKRY